jgi:hypothetical protein
LTTFSTMGGLIGADAEGLEDAFEFGVAIE